MSISTHSILVKWNEIPKGENEELVALRFDFGSKCFHINPSEKNYLKLDVDARLINELSVTALYKGIKQVKSDLPTHLKSCPILTSGKNYEIKKECRYQIEIYGLQAFILECKPLNIELHNAILAKKEIVGLLKNGSNPNAPDEKGNTPLHLAAKLDGYEQHIYTSQLLEVGANPNIYNHDGDTPLHVMIKHNLYMPRTLEAVLKAGGKVNLSNRKGQTVLHISVKHKSDLTACFDFEKNFGALLLEFGAAIDATDVDGNTPLHLAAIAKDDWSLQWLVQQGANPNIQNLAGNTPLHLLEDHKMVTFLIKNGAQVNLKNKNGSIPLHLLVKYAPKAIRRLIEAGSDCGVMNNQGSFPLHIAACSQAFLMKFEDFALLVEKTPDLNVQDKNGNTPLHYAVGFEGGVQLLIEKGAAVNLKNSKGKTPLDCLLTYLLHSDYLKEINSHNSLSTVGQLIQVLEKKKSELTSPHLPKPYREAFLLLIEKGAPITQEMITYCYEHARRAATFKFSTEQLFYNIQQDF